MPKSDYYGEGGRLSSSAAPILTKTAYAHDCKDASLLIDGLHKADLAHAIMLYEEGVIPEGVAQKLIRGLIDIQRIPAGSFPVNPELGDVYNSKDFSLKSLIGDAAGWIHAGRARREAVNIAYLIAVRKRLEYLAEGIAEFAESLLKLAQTHQDTISPDFTYLLHAHPTSLGHYLGTFLFGVLRDMDRLIESYSRLNRSPAGSGSVNGSSLPLNRERLAELLGFDSVIPHTRDAMWQVDLPMEILSNLAMMMTNLNRFADELQIWNTAEFSYVDLPDSLCRASVIMPQKKNPYPLAYFRGVSSWLTGKMASFGAHGKGVSGNPDSRIFIYGDLPEAIDKTIGALELFSAVLNDIEFRKDILEARVTESYAFTTDLADYLILEEKLDYRTAHHISGRVVKYMIDNGETGDQLTKSHVNKAAEAVAAREIDVPQSLIEKLKSPKEIVAARTSLGGAAPEQLADLFSQARDKIDEFDNWRFNLNSVLRFSLLDEVARNIIMPKAGLLELILNSAKEHPNKIAIREGKDRSVSYEGLLSQAWKMSQRFSVKREARVAIRIDDKINLMAAIIAVHFAGGVAVCLDVNDYSSMDQMMADCQPSVLLYENNKIDKDAKKKLAGSFKNLSWVDVPSIDDMDLDMFLLDSMVVPDIEPNQLAHLFYTSGTTGHRKGVEITHDAYVVPAHSLNQAMSHDKDIVEYVVGNIAHAFPFGRLRALLFIGATAVVDNGVARPQKILNQLKENDCNAIAAPASVIKLLVKSFTSDFGAFSGQLRVIKMGTQSIDIQNKRLLCRLFPNTKLIQQYGASEAPRSVVNDLKTATNDDTTGRILPGYYLSVRNEQGVSIVRPGHVGRIWIKGPHTARGYWNREEKTQTAFSKGWFITDDGGSVDEFGQVSIYGRLDEVINFGGQKLHPVDLEDIIEPFADGIKFVIVGIADPEQFNGEIPVFVQETNGQTGLSSNDTWLQTRMKITRSLGKSAKLLPKLAFNIDSIPYTGSGKPKRKLLSKQIEEYMDPN